MILSERFPSLEPIKIRQYPACEVFLLLKRLRVYDRKKNKTTTKNNNGVVRKKAGDNWF